MCDSEKIVKLQLHEQETTQELCQLIGMKYTAKTLEDVNSNKLPREDERNKREEKVGLFKKCNCSLQLSAPTFSFFSTTYSILTTDAGKNRVN